MDPDPLLGRDRELAALRHALGEVTDGANRTILVGGDPGIGKTRLLAELTSMAGERSFLVLSGRASEFEHYPFGAFVDALDDYLRTRPPDVLAGLAAAERTELAAVFPAVRRMLGLDGTTGAADDRVRGYAAIRSLLDVLADDRPVLLLLDDLHWSDRGSLELLAHLLRRPPRARVLIAGAYRPRQVDPDFGAAVARAADCGDATCLELGPLSLADAGVLVDLTGPPLADLHGASGGNPFYLLELARHGPTADVATAAALPPSVARAIITELDPLPAASRRFAETAAVTGDPFELDLVIATSGLGEDDGFTALDDLAALGLIRATEVPRRFAFRHPLVRQAIYQSLPPGRRLATHQRCAAALAQAGPTTRAHHVEHAARPGDQDAISVLAEAARQTAARAPANAVRWLRTAVRLLPPQAGPAQRLDLLRPLPGLLTSLGEHEAAHNVLLESVELADAADPGERVALATACATLEQLLGRHEDAHRRLTITLASLPDARGPEAVSVMIALMMDGFYRRRPDEAQDWGHRAVAEARRLGDSVLEAAASATGALIHALSGSVQEAERYRADTLAVLAGLTDAELAERLDVLGSLAGAELYLDHYEDAAVHADRGLRIGRSTGGARSAPTLIPTLGTASWVLGRTGDALELLDEAVEQARAARDPQPLAWHLFNLSLAEIVAGRIEAALSSGRESLLLARNLGDSVIATWAGATVAFAELEGGDAQAALTTLVGSCGGEDLPNLPGGWRTHFLEIATRCHVALGRLDKAEESAAFAEAWAAEVDLPYARSMALRARAVHALASGDAASAAECALAAADAAEGISARIDAARARIVAGQALGQVGRDDAAIAQLEQAAASLHSCGSVRFRDEAERELGRLGRRPHRRSARGDSARGVSSLTSREREIADLVVNRHTNAEIAAQLFLSGKTVESHLRNIFRKLEVTSRADVARAVEAHHRGQPL